MNKITLLVGLSIMIMSCGDDFMSLTPAEYVQANNLETTELAEGVLIVVSEQGNDVKPTANDEILVNYTGKLTDGTEFGSGTNARLSMNNLIRGWTIGLQEIGEGGRCTLVIPSSAGYGSTGQNDIPPDATLIFDIELVSVGSAADDFVKENNLTTTVLPYGVHIIITKPGSDVKPTLQDRVRVKYSGRLVNGEVFDSNDDISFALSSVILGWQVGIPEIGEGGSCTLIVPPLAGYGSSARPSIPANSVLIFDVELFEVQ